MGLAQYLKETQGELKHVSWPTRAQTINYTIVVIVVSVITSIVLGLFDGLFRKALEIIVQ